MKSVYMANRVYKYLRCARCGKHVRCRKVTLFKRENGHRKKITRWLCSVCRIEEINRMKDLNNKYV